MRQGLIEDENEYETRCFGLVRFRKRRYVLEEQPAVDIVQRLHALMRAKKSRMANFDTEEREERLEAAYHATKKPPNLEVARSHMRLSLAARKMHVEEQCKYEVLRNVSAKLEEARRTASEAESMLTTAKTLQEIVASMPDSAAVMDMLREQLHLVDEHTDELCVPLSTVCDNVDVELDALFHIPEKENDLTDVIVVQKKRVPIKMG